MGYGPLVPLLGFTPDLPPTTPGSLVDCTQLVPYEAGMEAAPVAVNSALAVLAAECRGAVVATKLDGTRRLFAGTQTKLYEASTSTWTDVSRAGNYTGGSDNRWSFAQFGNVSLASNSTEVIQQSTSGAFADLATAPKAKIIFTVAGFVMALGYDSGGGLVSDGWFCSAYQDYTGWTPSIATQCANGRLFQSQGAITAGARLFDDAIIYKDSAMYVGRYVGPSIIWAFEELSSSIGCVGQEAVVNTGTSHIFAALDGIYMYDGSRPVDISGPVKQFWINDLSQQFRSRVVLLWEKQKSRVWIFYPSNLSTTGQPDSCLVYHVGTKQWGRANRSIEAALNYVTPGVTYDGLGSIYSTYDSLPNISYDSSYWLSGAQNLAVFSPTHQLQTLTGGGSNASFTTGDIGDDDKVLTLTGVRPRYVQGPSTGSMESFRRQVLSDGAASTQVIGFSDGKFPIRQSARWHRFRVDSTGSMRCIGMQYEAKAAGNK